MARLLSLRTMSGTGSKTVEKVISPMIYINVSMKVIAQTGRSKLWRKTYKHDRI